MSSPRLRVVDPSGRVLRETVQGPRPGALERAETDKMARTKGGETGPLEGSQENPPVAVPPLGKQACLVPLCASLGTCVDCFVLFSPRTRSLTEQMITKSPLPSAGPDLG